MKHPDEQLPVESVADADEQAAAAFLRRRAGHVPDWHADDGVDPAALARIERAWQAVGDRAAAPELLVLREAALARMRAAQSRRWRLRGGTQRRLAVAASAAAVALLAGIGWTLWSRTADSHDYRTDVGEQRAVELLDGSHIALDSQTMLNVRLRSDARVVALVQGQAQFVVAKDALRPFRVEAGGQAIVAIGTSFTVEYADRTVRVVLLDGRLAVTPAAPAGIAGGDPPSVRAARTVYLVAGEALEVGPDGTTTVNHKADLDAAVAWRQGKVMFRDEPLGAAVRRLNRYTRLQLELDDPSLVELRVSGVFEAGDTRAFAEAIGLYLPVRPDYTQPGLVRLFPRR